MWDNIPYVRGCVAHGPDVNGERVAGADWEKTIAEFMGYVRFALPSLIRLQVYVDPIDREGCASCLFAQLD